MARPVCIRTSAAPRRSDRAFGGIVFHMGTDLKSARSRVPIFGIASLSAPLIAAGLWVLLADQIDGIYTVLVLTAVGVALALVARRRQEACRPLSHVGLLLNGGGFAYVFLGLFV